MTGLRVRRVPPAHTPLSARAVQHAILCGIGWHDDPRESLRARLRTAYEADDVLLVDSGTHALELAMRLATRESAGNAIVALPAYTCYDVATAAVGAGLRIALYDLDPNTLAPNTDSLSLALAAGARIVVVSPLYGIPVDWDAIERCAAVKGALVIEDAAQGHGGTWRGRILGSWGAMSVLSFGRGKGWTGGCGGALLVRRGVALPRQDVAWPPLRNRSGLSGIAAAAGQWALSRPALFGFAAALPGLHLGETLYHDPEPARGLPRGASGLLEATSSLVAREAEIRRANAETIRTRIAKLRSSPLQSMKLPLVPEDGTAGFLRFPAYLPGGFAGIPDVHLARELGLAPAYPATLSSLSAVRERMDASERDTRWPGADRIVRELVTLPTHSLTTAQDGEELLQLLSRALDAPAPE